MDMDRLRALLQHNEAPAELPTTEQLAVAEAELGLAFPADYKEFITWYGTGMVAGFLRILNPVSRVPRANLLDAARSKSFDGSWAIRELFPETLPYPRYPEHAGLLPWSNTINGDVLYWLTRGLPDSWPVVVWKRGGEFLTFDTNVARFVGSLLLGRKYSDLFPANVPFGEGEFVVVAPRG